MSSVSEAVSRRTTLGYLADHYGYELVPSFAANVTITSLADDVASVVPGALFVARGPVDDALLERVLEQGAYAALVPPESRPQTDGCELPLLIGNVSGDRFGEMANDVSGSPASMLAVFALASSASNPSNLAGASAAGANGSGRADDMRRNVTRLSRLLHMLGNPVSVIGSFGSQSLERPLPVECPLGLLDVQRTLGVCQEDGAAAVVIALDDATLEPGALSGINVDVLGVDGMDSDPRNRDIAARASDRYGFVMDSQTHLTGRTAESDQIAMQFPSSQDAGIGDVKRSSLAIAMVMAAGVRRNNIRNALRVSRDLGK
ncbi:UDP-N-acetylmuramyl peptide synthase [Bifidobacterium aerophilum]|uniref:UDP-N-acetylmuramyl peptide synthase n=1 Tax=Bifidobacterium aerophilum TaxID=1798155 RepID=A0A6N9Z2Z4_9BIFI|nr:UDP-N-acetylmuramyl peptide synthase [Bifidobacterium aerophilum]NEG88958.1 UDP-N-acetylmuramyl peptide synthase [Bifidobacterium aerophilum]